MAVITVVNKVFTNKIFSIHNNKQSSKDIFMKEGEVIEVERVSSFDNLLLHNNNNNKPLPMTTRPLLLWCFTKGFLRRITEGRTQLDEEDDIDDESVEENDGRKRRDKGEGKRWEKPRQEELSLKARAHVHTFHFFFMCPVASEGSNSLVAVSSFGDGKYEWGGI